MKFKVSRKTVYGSILVALAFSDTLKATTTWMYPFMVLSLLVILYFMNVASGHGLKRGKYLFGKYLKLGIAPYVLIFGYSVFLIIVNHQGSRFFNRSLGSILIAVMTIITSASLVFIFKEKAPDVICYGLIINYIIHVALNFGKIGFRGLLQHIINPLNTYQGIFELHSVGFTLNLLLFYYLIKKDKSDSGKMITILIILYLVMKRIACVGLVLSLVVWFITDVILKNRGEKKYKAVLWVLVIGSFIYVWFICMYPEQFKMLMVKLGVFNRYLISNSFAGYYSFDIRYLGRGFGFVSVLMPDMDIAGASVAALHNDVLKDFIEEGFIGFCIIYYYFFVGLPKSILKNCSIRAFSCVAILLVYTFVTMLTDNVVDYVSYTCTLFTLYGTVHLYGNNLFPDKRKTIL